MTTRLRPGDFAEITAFAAVAEARSFRRAARALGLAPSTLSHAVKALETRLGTRLLHRTTRAVAPTEAGATLLAELAPALAALGGAVARAGNAEAEVAGTVRLAAPRLAIGTLLAPAALRLARAFPRLTLDVRTVEHPGDLVRDGFDLGIRLGDTIDQDMVAVALTPAFRTAVVGAPAYFADRAVPVDPRDLADHACIGCRSGPGGSLYRWRFAKGDQALTVDVSGPLVTDDPDLMLAAALDGIGLWHGVEHLAQPHVEAGRLIRVLADWSPDNPGFFLCYAGGAPLGPAARAVVDALKAVARG
jgi:DNA-binding transcriptional LysR family regulator